MGVKIEPGWQKILKPEFEKEYFKNLLDFVRTEYREQPVYPAGSHIFNAFNKCEFNNTKVVIIGQDPYHGPRQANGLSFSVKDDVPIPPSLVNIFKEVLDDTERPFPKNGNLERWAKQGVLLLNATLTVRARQPGSHQNKGWEQFTDSVIKTISDEKENVVFMLWGGFAKKKGEIIDTTKHLVLESGHPSPMSANRGHWFGNKHFSQCNSYLKEKKLDTIEW